MNRFDNIYFRGTFRTYQQRVLDNADYYLEDGKINIVAAPGSGKTVLGLELIRRIGEPCIILSPATAIREQWGHRLDEMFLDETVRLEDIYSTDLHKVRLINSITYQALYHAMEKVKLSEEDEVDVSDIDLINTIKKYCIKVICLDEAHHLKNEWQKALEKFIGFLDSDVKIISLTATPPYDANSTEWQRYNNICGEIDEEIFVPELVSQETLCPHQDYIYFNYPTEAETAVFCEHRKNAIISIQQIGMLDSVRNICEQLNRERNYEKLFEYVREYIALLILFNYYQFNIDKKLIRELTTEDVLPELKISQAQMAIQFLLDKELLSDEQKEEIINILKENDVYNKHKVELELTEKQKRTLVSSVGKLESIKQIANNEFATMGTSLRMLILTDYIKKETISKVASNENFSSVNVVSIFETIRRSNSMMNIGVLSGNLVILPDTVNLDGLNRKITKIIGTRYYVVDTLGSSHDIVEYVGKLFERGEIQILIGTKSLLGEGWDSPCINSLILASFVGSFVLSNQMRGRAIRIDKSNPQKTSNIWHLVTLEPKYVFEDSVAGAVIQYMGRDVDNILSWDYEILKRRFDSFIGPNYATGEIESGIDRISIIQPPYSDKGVEDINRKMFFYSSQRDTVRKMWRDKLYNKRFNVVLGSIIPKERKVPVFTLKNSLFVDAIILLFLECMLSCGGIITYAHNTKLGIGLVCLAVAMLMGIYNVGRKLLSHLNPRRSLLTLGTAICETLKECGVILEDVNVKSSDGEFNIELHLENASIHDQNIFNSAMKELLSPIENPRYILIKKDNLGRHNYFYSYACPSVIGRKKEYVEILEKKLRKSMGKFELVYTHKEGGRQTIMSCRQNSYITYNHLITSDKYKITYLE